MIKLRIQKDTKEIKRHKDIEKELQIQIQTKSVVLLDDFLNYFLYKMSLNSKQIHQIVHKYTFYEVCKFDTVFLLKVSKYQTF